MTEAGHNSKAAQSALQAYAERVERLKADKKAALAEYSDAIKEVMAEAKAEGYDTAALKEILRLRAMSDEKREVVGFYADVLGVFG